MSLLLTAEEKKFIADVTQRVLEDRRTRIPAALGLTIDEFKKILYRMSYVPLEFRSESDFKRCVEVQADFCTSSVLRILESLLVLVGTTKGGWYWTKIEFEVTREVAEKLFGVLLEADTSADNKRFSDTGDLAVKVSDFISPEWEQKARARFGPAYIRGMIERNEILVKEQQDRILDATEAMERAQSEIRAWSKWLPEGDDAQK